MVGAAGVLFAFELIEAVLRRFDGFDHLPNLPVEIAAP
jgi:hypothetical protein